MKPALLQIKDLKVSVEGKEVLKGINLQVNSGEVHAIMGRNGSGKTTLTNTIMGHPKYTVTGGDILVQGKSILDLSPDERAKEKLFVAFQYPLAIPGVSVANFLRASIRAIHGKDLKAKDVRQMIKAEISNLNIPNSFMNRSLNDGFSGGEKKRLEILQMKLLQPRIAILDETDSGLDIDALKLVSNSVDEMRNSDRGMVIITHYQRMLNYIKPDKVHVLLDGEIIKTGGPELALELEERGYDWVDGQLAHR